MYTSMSVSGRVKQRPLFLFKTLQSATCWASSCRAFPVGLLSLPCSKGSMSLRLWNSAPPDPIPGHDTVSPFFRKRPMIRLGRKKRGGLDSQRTPWREEDMQWKQKEKYYLTTSEERDAPQSAATVPFCHQTDSKLRERIRETVSKPYFFFFMSFSAWFKHNRSEHWEILQKQETPWFLCPFPFDSCYTLGLSHYQNPVDDDGSLAGLPLKE